MIPMSHIVVLSQSAFVEREVCSVLSAPHRASPFARLFAFARRGSAA
jgi:hypothetical protein